MSIDEHDPAAAGQAPTDATTGSARPAGSAGPARRGFRATSLRGLARETERLERDRGRDHHATLRARNDLTAAYLAAKHLEQAGALLAETVLDCRRVLGDQHPDTLIAEGNLATLQLRRGRPDLAVEMLESALSDRTAVFGPEHPRTLDARHGLGVALAAHGDAARARSVLDAALTERSLWLGPDHPDTAATRAELARLRPP